MLAPSDGGLIIYQAYGNLYAMTENDNDKVNMPSFPSPEPTVSYFDDLDHFKDFEKEFPAIVYNDALTSKLDFLTEPTVCPQHIDEFNLKDETSLSECDEVEQNILYFNDLFPFNVIYLDDSKSYKDNDDDDKIDTKQSFGGSGNCTMQWEPRRFFQTPIAPGDQEKQQSLVLHRTFAFRRIVVWTNLDRMLARCEETNLVLNWEKCYFIVKEGIVLGHKISWAGIEVDRAKIDVIAKLPYPTNVKGLLMKDAKFDFSDDCKKEFNILKEKLTTASIIISPNWNVPFELMCEASDFAVRAVLGQQIDKKSTKL
ncbi:reverse transcriptase domain-containing protein [Tanacetum coccineum]